MEQDRKGYEVRVRRDGRFWYVEIPALDGATQARRLDEVEAMAREYIALVTDDEAPAELDVHIELPEDVRALVAHVAELRAQAEAMQREASAEARQAAVRLKEDGLTGTGGRACARRLASAGAAADLRVVRRRARPSGPVGAGASLFGAGAEDGGEALSRSGPGSVTAWPAGASTSG